MATRFKILIVEPSVIVREGIMSIIEGIKSDVEFSLFETIDDASSLLEDEPFKIILINPLTFSQHRNKSEWLATLNKKNVVGLFTGYHDRDFSEKMTNHIFINDKQELIVKTLEKYFSPEMSKKSDAGETLSGREIDVLRLLAVGKSNKEIADKLFISVHTVMSHRKNISAKLGVKSAAALVIYAVANGLIDVEGYEGY